MKLWLIACLLVGAPVYSAAMRERVQEVVVQNNVNVRRIQNLYAHLPTPLVNIVFGYLRTRLDTQRFDCYYTPDCSVGIIDQHGNKHYLVVAGYLPTRARKYMSIACIEKDALDPLVASIRAIEKTYKTSRNSEMAHYISFLTHLTFPGPEEIYLEREQFGPNFIVGYDELREKFAKTVQDESC